MGLVLGAGGVMGGAWLTGGLQALATVTGWDPASAEYVVGTSAGSMIGALCASGVPPWFMVAHSSGEVFTGLVDVDGRPAAEASRSAGAEYRLERGIPRIVLGSPRLVVNSFKMGARRPAAMAAGWLPQGQVSTEPLKRTVRRVVPSGWAPHPNYWAVAIDYRSGERTVFGRDGSPVADLADAVAASCAVPGFYAPVEIRGRRYIDGGIWSVSNLDLLAGLGLDVVICLNPMTSRHRPRGFKPGAQLAAAIRRPANRRLVDEARQVREGGAEVVLLQPTARDLRIMGANWMSSKRRPEVIETAIETVTDQLRDPAVAELLGHLPEGAAHKLRRPPGPPSSWPDILASPWAEAAS